MCPMINMYSMCGCFCTTSTNKIHYYCLYGAKTKEPPSFFTVNIKVQKYAVLMDDYIILFVFSIWWSALSLHIMRSCLAILNMVNINSTASTALPYTLTRT